MHNERLNEATSQKIINMIEVMLQIALKDLKTKSETDINFDELSELMNEYKKFDQLNDQLMKRWEGYTSELSDILKGIVSEAEQNLKQIVDLDRPIQAYQKAIDRSKES